MLDFLKKSVFIALLLQLYEILYVFTSMEIIEEFIYLINKQYLSFVVYH